MKLWSSVRQQAGKLAFEADRMVRIKREESAIAGINTEVQTVQTNLGQIALALYRSGALANPQVAALAAQIAKLEGDIKQHEANIVAIRAEQPPEGEQAAAPPPAQATAPVPPPAEMPPVFSPPQAAAPVPPPPAATPFPSPSAMPPAEPAAPVPSLSEAPAPEAEGKVCASCGARIPEKAIFCPECGTRAT